MRYGLDRTNMNVCMSRKMLSAGIQTSQHLSAISALNISTFISTPQQ